MKTNVTTARNFRKEVNSFLQYLSAQNMVQPSVSLAIPNCQEKELPLALTKLWFDELYPPAKADIEGNLKVLPEALLDTFNASFNSDELEILEKFNRFFELRIHMAKNAVDGLAGLYESPLWQHMKREAKITLELLAPLATANE